MIFRRKIVVALIGFLFILTLKTGAQMPMRSSVAVTGWADNTHYILRTLNADGFPVTLSVDVRTGKSTVMPPVRTAADILAASLPDGVRVSAQDVYSPDYKSIIISKDNDIYYFATGSKELKRLTDNRPPEVNVKFSPDGKRIAYTRNKDLYVYDLIRFTETRITNDASERIYNGYSSWVYMEEILGRTSNYAAFWWSPDGLKIAFLRTDESEVPLFNINRIDSPDGLHGTMEVTPYPKPGDPNPKVKMGIADVNTGKTAWVKTDYSIDQYIAWPFWTPDSRKLAIQVLNRDQNSLKIFLADAVSGDFEEIYSESRKTWVEFRDDIYVMKNGSGLIIKSYKSDWENLYYYGWDGKMKLQLTAFSFRVNEILRVDEKAGIVWFSATGTESTDNHIFRIGLDGTNLVQLTKEAGTHSAIISPDGTYIADTWNSLNDPGAINLINSKGKYVREIHSFGGPAGVARNSRQEMVRIPTADGLFNMPAVVIYPINFDPTKKYPVVFTVYGGPDSKNVFNRWSGVDPSWYSQNGIITFRVDHRGSGHFGKAGLDYMYRSLGKWEILDYSDAVKWLISKPWVDKTKIGITGGSYGGYMTCMALTKGAAFWTHGFANYSVTDWRLYDNIYTERFMDTPQDNPDGYKDGSALTFAANMKGKLFITHGDADDNVHIQNTIYLVSKLQDSGKSFEMMIYPGVRHGWRGDKATHLTNTTYSFWLRSFFPEKN